MINDLFIVPDRFEATDDRLEEPDSEPDPILARFFLLRPTREPLALPASEAGDLDLDRDFDLFKIQAVHYI